MQLVKQLTEALASQLAQNSTEEVHHAPNTISVAHGLANHLIHPVESLNLQRRENVGTYRNELNAISVKQAQQLRLGSMWNEFVINCELRFFDAA